MATTIKDNSTKRNGSVRVRSQNGIPKIDETYSFIVVSTLKNEDYLTVIRTAGLPIVGLNTSPSGLGLCQSISAERREENPYYWDVTCEFSSNVQDQPGNSQNENGSPSSSPTSWIPIYETKFERIQEVCTVDADGSPIVNSAGAVFPDSVTRTRKIPIWEFYQFESASITDEEIIERSETVNETPFKGRAAKTLLLTVLNSVVGYYYGARLRFTHYQLKYKRDDWRQKRADVGYFYLDGTTREPYLEPPPPDPDGIVILGPLDGNGEKTASVTDPPAILYFDMCPTLDFAEFLRI